MDGMGIARESGTSRSKSKRHLGRSMRDGLDMHMQEIEPIMIFWKFSSSTHCDSSYQVDATACKLI